MRPRRGTQSLGDPAGSTAVDHPRTQRWGLAARLARAQDGHPPRCRPCAGEHRGDARHGSRARGLGHHAHHRAKLPAQLRRHAHTRTSAQLRDHRFSNPPCPYLALDGNVVGTVGRELPARSRRWEQTKSGRNGGEDPVANLFEGAQLNPCRCQQQGTVGGVEAGPREHVVPNVGTVAVCDLTSAVWCSRAGVSYSVPAMRHP